MHFHAGFFFTAPKGGWEFPALWAVALIVQSLLGDGALALSAAIDFGMVPARAAISK